MKLYLTAGAILLVILNGLLLIPATGGHSVPIVALSILVAVLVLAFSLVGGKTGQRESKRGQDHDDSEH